VMNYELFIIILSYLFFGSFVLFQFSHNLIFVSFLEIAISKL
jgi:hypothetical protein